jgi:hypothetical protein
MQPALRAEEEAAIGSGPVTMQPALGNGIERELTASSVN